MLDFPPLSSLATYTAFFFSLITQETCGVHIAPGQRWAAPSIQHKVVLRGKSADWWKEEWIDWMTSQHRHEWGLAVLCNRKVHILTTPLPMGVWIVRGLDVLGEVCGGVELGELEIVNWLGLAQPGLAKREVWQSCLLASWQFPLSLTVSVSTTMGRNKLPIIAESVCNPEREVGRGCAARLALL